MLKNIKLKNFLETLSDLEKQDLVDRIKKCALGSKDEPIEIFYGLDVEDLETYKDKEESSLLAIYENRIIDELFQDQDQYEEYMESDYDEATEGLYEVIENNIGYNINYFSPIKENEFLDFTRELNLENDIDDLKEVYLDILKGVFENHKHINEILALGKMYIDALYSEGEKNIDNFYIEYNRF